MSNCASVKITNQHPPIKIMSNEIHVNKCRMSAVCERRVTNRPSPASHRQFSLSRSQPLRTLCAYRNDILYCASKLRPCASRLAGSLPPPLPGGSSLLSRPLPSSATLRTFNIHLNFDLPRCAHGVHPVLPHGCFFAGVRERGTQRLHNISTPKHKKCGMHSTAVISGGCRPVPCSH